MEKNIIMINDTDQDKVYPKNTILIKGDRFAISNGVDRVCKYKFVPLFDAIEKSDESSYIKVSAKTGSLNAEYCKNFKFESIIDPRVYMAHFIPNNRMIEVINENGDHVGYFPVEYLNVNPTISGFVNYGTPKRTK